jgi:catalase
MHDDGSLEIEMGAEMTPTYGKLPKEGGSPLGSNKAADAVEEANEKGHDAHPY